LVVTVAPVQVQHIKLLQALEVLDHLESVLAHHEHTQVGHHVQVLEFLPLTKHSRSSATALLMRARAVEAHLDPVIVQVQEDEVGQSEEVLNPADGIVL
jgi:hypothetical protein